MKNRQQWANCQASLILEIKLVLLTEMAKKAFGRVGEKGELFPPKRK